jgi:GT2 family glycosyltransferase
MGTVALIIVGAAEDVESFETSAASARQQLGVRCDIFPKKSLPRTKRGASSKVSGNLATPAVFADVLKAALDSGAAFVTCVRAGDTLPPHTLHRVLEAATSHRAPLVYGDSETQINGQWQPWFKPAWNAEYALGTDYPLDLLLIQSALIRACLLHQPWPTNAPELAWMALVQVWANAAKTVLHLPHVVYRFHSPLSDIERLQRHAAANAALARLEPDSRLLPLFPLPIAEPSYAPRRLQRSLCEKALGTRVSLIIPTRDQQPLLQACIESLLEYTDWPQLEIIIVDNDSTQAVTHTYFRKLEKQGIRIFPVSGAFNFSRINNLAVEIAQGEVIGLINNDIQALHAGWLQEMLSHLFQPGVGAVGAKLLWPNHMVQHGGIVLGVGNVAAHYGNLCMDDDWGDHGRNQLAMQVSGVTAACLLMRKADYVGMGGLDEVAFPVAFNDVDLCLRLRAAGKSIIWTPYAKLLHAESASRGREDTPQKQARAQRELAQLRARWGAVLLQDPAYHPSLNLDSHSHPFSGLALPPRKRNPRWAGLVYEENE